MESCMNSNFHTFKLGNIANITKLAGFEHSEYIQPNATKVKVNETDVAMYLGLNIKNGKIVDDIHWYIPLPLSKKLERSALIKKCIILPYVGSVGDLAIYNNVKRHHLASNVAKIELQDEMSFSTEYLYYYLKSPYGQRQLLFYIQGGVQKNITMDAIRKTVVSVVPNSEAVVKLLTTLDDKINLNNQINAELEAMAKLIYDYWFVQFDFPDENGKPYKSSGGKMVWNEELKREIPEGWKNTTLSKIANITMGQSPPGSSYNQDEIGTIFYQGSTDFGNRYPVIRQYTSSPSRLAKLGDILLSVRAPVGDMNIANHDCCIGRGLAALNSKIGAQGFLYEVMKYFKQVFDLRNGNGTTFGSITKDDLYSLPLAYPSDEVVMRFEEIVSPMYWKQNLIETENQKLIELRDWLLPMLMNGQVKIE